MEKLNYEEQLIHTGFDEITVDEEGFVNRFRTTAIASRRPVKKLPKIVAAILITGFLSVATVYAASDGWQFLQNLFSPFAELAVDQGGVAYAEDQGIRIEILGAEQIEGRILLLLTVQDTSGEHGFHQAVTAFPAFADTFSGSMGGINFNAETRTHYIEAQLEMAYDTVNLENLRLQITHLWVGADGGEPLYGNWHFEVNFSDVVHQTITLTDVAFTIDNIDFNLNYLRVTPIAVQMNGSTIYNADWHNIFFDIQVETGSSEIQMVGSAGQTDWGNFEFTHTPERPIDIENVTAITINGIRIPISE